MAPRILHFWLLANLISILPTSVFGLGCMKTICSNEQQGGAQPTNKIVDCPNDNGYCGNYKALRSNHQFVEAVDLECSEGVPVFAPFDGVISYYQPFGGANTEKECADHGVRIEGTGQWRGYVALLSTVKLDKYGGRVKAGEKLGRVGNLECHTGQGDGYFLRLKLLRQGMCTGQLCETNGNNAIIGAPFKYDSLYNGVRGWEIKCPNTRSSQSHSTSEGSDEERAPQIYSGKASLSPIDGDIIGRIRLDYSGGNYAGCENDGLFIVGSGKWSDYEVRIYNVRFQKELALGNRRVEQGEHIGQRLTCSSSPQSIFMEVRFQGSVVDISDAISATSCRHKTFNTLF